MFCWNFIYLGYILEGFGDQTPTIMSTLKPLKLKKLPQSLSKEEAVKIDLVEGVPIFRASVKVQNRIEFLLIKQQESSLSNQEEQEINDYEDLDNYLSLINRTIRNLYI